jgi:hypothetical protein
LPPPQQPGFAVSTGAAAVVVDAQPQPDPFEAPPAFAFSVSDIEFSGPLATRTL